jgi:ATPase subunit of ABC transporter with duplicated ATPase domains
MLAVRNLEVEVGGRLVVDRASFSIRTGDKVGLVGRNGAGKTSLFKVLGGDNPPAAGAVSVSGPLGYLPQEPRRGTEIDATSALTHVLSGRGLDEAATRVEKLRLRVEENPSEANVAKFARAEEAYRHDGGYAAEPEVRRICAGLGLKADRLDLPVTALSGGERRRVELARILFAGSASGEAVLLLDEPTNHLDADAKDWLMSFLRAYRGALLVISHDLELLDEAITRILHLDEGTVVEYKGTYSQYQEARVRDETRLAKIAERQAAEITRLKTLADSMRGQTEARARKAKTLDHRVEKMIAEKVVGPRKQRRFRVNFPPPPRSGDVVLQVEALTKGYGGPPVIEDVSFTVGRGERLLVLGLNGAGKTTMLRVLAGLTDADVGNFRLGANVSLGYYAQEHETLTARPAIDQLRAHAPYATTDVDLRSLLGMFGLTGDMAFQDASTFSGGEKTKLALSQLVAGSYNLLLLDEPTNNLDPPSREGVAEALSDWPGTMLVVSHDAGFVERLAPDRVLILPDGTLDFWSEDLLELVALA